MHIFHEYLTCRFIFGLFLKLRKYTFQEKKSCGAPMKPSELFWFKDTINFAPLLSFLSGINGQCICKIKFLNSVAWPKITLKIVNLTVLLHKEFEILTLHEIFFLHSLFCITSKKLPYTTLCYVASRFILPSGTFAHGFIMLPPRSLTSYSSWGCSLAIIQKAIYLLPTSRFQFFPCILLFCNFIFTFLHLELIITSGKRIFFTK